jgi:hypothetical protein
LVSSLERRSAETRSGRFPDGIGPVGCVNVEHEEVLLMPRWIDTGRVTFKYGLGEEFIGVPAGGWLTSRRPPTRQL